MRETAAEQPVRRTFAFAILAITVPLQILQLTPDEWNLQTSLPFQLCGLAWMFAVYALWTRSRIASTITHLWGITLTTQGMLTPDLASDFPEQRFLMFWAMHVLIVWASFFLVLGLRILPTWHTYRQTVAVTRCWAVSVYVFNVIAATRSARCSPCRGAVSDASPWCRDRRCSDQRGEQLLHRVEE